MDVKLKKKYCKWNKWLRNKNSN